MTEDIKNKLLMCAEMYHRADFIQSDPVQFPHRYTLKQDIEVSGLLTAIMSFWQSQTDLEESGRIARANGRFALSVCIVLPVGEGFSFRSNQ